MNRKATPIFVIGANRSGTTWLSNLLCNHSKVIGAQSEHHFGIIETNLFGRMQKIFGSLDNPTNRIAFVEAWSQTDFFAAVDADKTAVYNLGPADYIEIFQSVMEEFANKNSVDYWLQKLPTTEFCQLGSLKIDSKIIVITRQMIPNLTSKFGLLESRSIKSSIIRSGMDYALQEKLAKQILRHPNTLHVAYENLVADTQQEISRICDFIGFEFEQAVIENQFARNTSFKEPRTDSADRPSLSSVQKLVANASYGLARCAPTSFLVWMMNKFRRNDSYLIPGTFRAIQNKFKVGVE